jgi:hypothetical protein
MIVVASYVVAYIIALKMLTLVRSIKCHIDQNLRSIYSFYLTRITRASANKLPAPFPAHKHI